MTELNEILVPEVPVAEIPRGVKPAILLDQIRNTIPFLFQEGADLTPAYARLIHDLDPSKELSHSEYFRLCLSAHWATVGSFVPTDVDNQIRFKLWHPALPTSVMREMAETTLESFHWDFRPYTRRYVVGPESGRILAGHHGEWFSVAVGAYCALRKRDADMAGELAVQIEREVAREAEIYDEFRRKRDGLGLLRAAMLVAHNLGDLDRVFEAWGVATDAGTDDVLAKLVYKCGHENDRRHHGLLFEAGELNKAFMADENHRHFALRKPRALRRSSQYLLDIAPFLDTWGTRVSQKSGLTCEEIGEVVEALIDGWEWLPKTVAYSRAIAGITDAFPGGLSRLCQYVPAKAARKLQAGPLRALTSVRTDRFEDQWSTRALSFVKQFKSAQKK